MAPPACTTSKANFLTFMDDNIVWMAFTPSWALSGRFDFCLTKSDRQAMKGNASCDVYRLEKPAGNQLEQSFKAFWCHYEPDQLHSIVVTDEADFMFTAKMDGCSFAFGSKTADGARRVAHANRSDTMAQREDRQWTDISLHFQNHEDIDGVLQPTSYMLNGKIAVTTFGVRDTADNEWSFWYQMIDTTNNQSWKHLGLRHIPLI